MRRLAGHLLALGVLLTSAEARAATTQIPVQEIDSVAALHANQPGKFTSPPAFQIHLASYYCVGDPSNLPCQPDGGEGLLTWVSGTCSASSGDDGGSMFYDASGNCWRRQNLNGDLRQWGLTQNSDYDAIYVLNHAGHTLLNATDRIEIARDALLNVGIMDLHTRQVNLKLDFDHLGAPLAIPAGGSLTCDTPPVKRAPNADYTHIRGSLIIAHEPQPTPNFIDAFTKNDVEIRDCAAIIPEWYIDPAKTAGWGISFTSPAASYADLEAIRANMVLAGDFAIKAGEGAYIHDVGIYGFDNCLYAAGAPRFLGKNVSMDCSIGGYFANEGGGMEIVDFDNDPYLTKQPGFANEEYWSITGIRAGPSGECELKLQLGANGNFPLTDLHDSATDDSFGRRGDPYYYPAWVAGLTGAGLSCSSAGTGRFGNDAAWGIRLVPSAPGYQWVDLIGSHYAPSGAPVQTSGDWNANTGVIYMTGPVSNLAPGMKAASAAPGWPAGDVFIKAVLPRCTGPDGTDGYNGCVIVSPAPTAAATGAAISFYDPSDSFPPSPPPCDGSGVGYCLYYNAAERYVAGNSDAGTEIAKLPASRGGHLGAGFFVNGVSGFRTVNAFSYSHYYHSAINNAGSCNYVQLKGDDNAELGAGNTVGLYVVGASRGCTFVGHRPGKQGAPLVQDTFSTGDYEGSEAGKPVHQSASVSIPQSYTGNVTVSSTVNWPTRGTMHICKQTVTSGSNVSCDTTSDHEFAAYHIANGTQFALDFRGRFDTAPTFFAAGATLFSTTVSSAPVNSTDDNGDTVFADLDNTARSGNAIALEVLHGAVLATNVHSTSIGTAFISTNTTGVIVTGARDPYTTILFEDDHARSLTSIDAASQFANYAPRALSTPLIYSNTGPDIPQVLTDAGGGVLASTYGAGPILVQNVSNWPAAGIALIDNEYVAYSNPGPSGQLTIERRGLCGTMAAAHAQYAVVLNAEAILGCSPNASPILALRNDGALVGSQPLLAHGQVYMSYDGSQYIRLCAQGGGGLIIDGTLRQVSAKCVTRDKANASSNSLNYVYAEYHLAAVTNIGNNGSGKLRLTLTGMPGFDNTTPISCALVDATGAIVTIADDNNTTLAAGNTKIDINDVNSFTGSGGTCSYIALQFVTALNGGNHVTGANGVEIRSGHPEQTLVGMLWVGASNAVNDTVIKRDVASWFNRRPKTCRQTALALKTTTSTGYVEIDPNKECEFVAWSDNDIWWSAGERGSNNTNGDGVAVTVGFDNNVGQAEEVSTQNASGAGANIKQPLTMSGSWTNLSEGKHFITALGRAVTAGTATFDASFNFLEARLPQ